MNGLVFILTVTSSKDGIVEKELVFSNQENTEGYAKKAMIDWMKSVNIDDSEDPNYDLYLNVKSYLDTDRFMIALILFNTIPYQSFGFDDSPIIHIKDVIIDSEVVKPVVEEQVIQVTEKKCLCCDKMNDIGILTCWNCGNPPE